MCMCSIMVARWTALDGQEPRRIELATQKSGCAHEEDEYDPFCKVKT